MPRLARAEKQTAPLKSTDTTLSRHAEALFLGMDKVALRALLNHIDIECIGAALEISRDETIRRRLCTVAAVEASVGAIVPTRRGTLRTITLDDVHSIRGAIKRALGSLGMRGRELILLLGDFESFDDPLPLLESMPMRIQHVFANDLLKQRAVSAVLATFRCLVKV